MKKIYEIQDIDLTLGDVKDTVNELVRVMNKLKCVEEDIPIYETLGPQDVLIISKSEDGLLVAANDGNGRVLIERIPWLKDVKKEET